MPETKKLSETQKPIQNAELVKTAAKTNSQEFSKFEDIGRACEYFTQMGLTHRSFIHGHTIECK